MCRHRTSGFLCKIVLHLIENILGNAQLYGSFHLIKIAKKEHMCFTFSGLAVFQSKCITLLPQHLRKHLDTDANILNVETETPV